MNGVFPMGVSIRFVQFKVKPHYNKHENERFFATLQNRFDIWMVDSFYFGFNCTIAAFVNWMHFRHRQYLIIVQHTHLSSFILATILIYFTMFVQKSMFDIYFCSLTLSFHLFIYLECGYLYAICIAFTDSDTVHSSKLLFWKFHPSFEYEIEELTNAHSPTAKLGRDRLYCDRSL